MEKVFISRHSRPFHFDFFNAIIFPTCTLTWRVNNYVSRQEEGINREMKVRRDTISVLMIVTSNSISENLTIRFCQLLI